MNLDITFLKEKFGKNLIVNEILSKYSWFNLGGPAEIFFRPESKDQLIEFIKYFKDKHSEMHVLGAGSNTLIRDFGIKGVVIKLGSKFSDIKRLDQNTLISKNLKIFPHGQSKSNMQKQNLKKQVKARQELFLFLVQNMF